MVLSGTSSSWLASALALLSFFSLLLPTNALYFYMEGRQTKCFFEDLPKDTLVAGMRQSLETLRRNFKLTYVVKSNRPFRNRSPQPPERHLRGRP